MIVANGGPRMSPPGTLTQLFFGAVDQYDRPDALQFKIGGRYEPIAHRRIEERVRHVARGLAKLGIVPGDRVAIVSENRPEWAIADFGCLTARVVDVAVYPTLPAAQIAYILRDSGAIAAFVSGTAQAEKLMSIRNQLPALQHVISFDVLPAALADISIISIIDLEHRGAEDEPAEAAAHHRAAALGAKPDDLATLLYTSGTTGDPKGVMLTHDNIYSNVDAIRDLIPFSEGDVALSFLPLSHIFERTVGHYFMFATGTSIAYAESIEAVPANMLEVRPTLMVSVPRLYEKMFARVLEAATTGGWIKRKVFRWARGVGEEWADTVIAAGAPSGLLASRYSLAQRLVFSKLQQRTGGRIRYFVSGGAPLAPEINRFFYAAGLTILEGYGLTETSPVISANTPERFRIGTVGPPIQGVSVAIAEDGEILARGPNIMAGYFNMPDATADVIDDQGWFHTGDIGEWRDGFLAITDRKKDLIVTAGGKNIAPQPIENRIRANEYVAQAVVLGDRRRFPIALVVPALDRLERWARYKGLQWSDAASLVQLPEVQAKMEHEVLDPIADLARFEIPKKLILLPSDFSVERGELTPTLKVKRRTVEAHYKDTIDDVYNRALSESATAESH